MFATLAVVLLPAVLALPAADEALALVGARLLVAPGAEPLEHATVIVRDGRIEAVGGADLALPHDARAVDVAGLTLTAGWLDALQSRDLKFAPREDHQGRPQDDGRDAFVAMLEAERTGIAPERRVADVLPQDAADDEAARAAGFCAALVAPRGELLSGSASWLTFSALPPREALLAVDVLSVGDLEWRTGPENYEGSRYPATLMGVMAHLRQALLDAQHHAELRARVASGRSRARLPNDAVLAALAPVVAGEQALLLEAREEEDVRLVLGLARDFPDLRLVIGGGHEAWRVADELARAGVGVVLDLRFGEEPEDPDAPAGRRSKSKDKRSAEDVDAADPPAEGEGEGEGAAPDAVPEAAAEAEEPAAGASGAAEQDPAAPVRADPPAPWNPEASPRLRRERHELWLADVRGPAALVAAGVPVAVGSFGRKPADVLEDLQVAIDKGGLTHAAAVAALTTGAHAVLAGRAPVGRIAPGAEALLTGWSGEPFAKSTRARLLVVDGVLFDLRRPSAKDETPEKEEAEKEPASADADAAAAADAALAAWPEELEADREPPFRTGGDVLVRGATIHTASHGVLADHDLLVRDGKIAALGPRLAAVEGVREIDARGLHLTPGIIDCHSHTAIRGGVNEWTRVLTPEVSIEDEVDPDDVNVYRALAGGVTAARLLHGSANAIGGRHEVVKLRWGASAPEMVLQGAPRGVKFALGENPKQSNFGDGSRFPKTRMGVEAVLRRAFLAGRAYAETWRRYEAELSAGADPDPPRRDLRLEALAGIVGGTIAIHSHCYRADEILMLIALAEEFGVRIATLQHVLEGYKVAAEIAAHGAGGSTFVDWWGYKFEAYDATPYCAALMHEAGVNMSVNSDSDEHIRRLCLEAAKTVRYGGVPDEEALRMVTLNPALQLGIGERTGSIDVGKDADFALFTAEPFDVRAVCAMTFIDGELYFMRDDSRWKAWEESLPSRVEAAAARLARQPSPEPGPAERRLLEVPLESLERLPRPPGATLAPSNPPRPAGPRVALVGGTVHTLEEGPDGSVVHAPGVVLIENGLLRGVYAGDGAPPPGYATVDVTGLHVWPGLIDAGTSVGLQEVGSVAGTMDVREIGGDQPDLRGSTGFHPASSHIAVARGNGTTSVLVAPDGRGFTGQASLMGLEGWTAGEALIADGVALTLRAPRTPRRERGQDEEEDETRDGRHACDELGSGRPVRVEDEAGSPPALDDEGRKLLARIEDAWRPLREQLRAAREYARVVHEADRAGRPGPQPDARLSALAPYALGARPVIIAANWADEIMDAVRFGREEGLHLVIGGGREAWKVADELAAADVPVLLGPVLTLPMRREDPWDASYRAASVLHAAGVPFAFRSADSESARDLPFHAGMAVAHGLPADAALAALTRESAKILGVDALVGTLTAGKRADVLVTDGSPLQIRTQVRRLYIGGREVDLGSRHTDLYETWRARLNDPGRPSR